MWEGGKKIFQSRAFPSAYAAGRYVPGSAAAPASSVAKLLAVATSELNPKS